MAQEEKGLYEERISIASIIGSVVGNLGLSNVNNVLDDMVRWAFEAEMKIGSEKTYKKYECEIEIKNKKACLPYGLVELISIKYGNHYVEVTKKEFTHFHKGVSSFSSLGDAKTTTGGNRTIDVPGCLQVTRITAQGVWADGDTATLHFHFVNNGQSWVNSFTYTAQPGDTINEIAQGLYNIISAVHGFPATMVLSNNILEFTGVDFCVSFQVTPSVSSVGGSLLCELIQQSKEPKKSFNVGASNLLTPKGNSANLANGDSLAHGQSRNAQNAFNVINHSSMPKFSVSNGYIHFNFDGEAMENRVGIAYWGVWLDDDGFPLIKASHEDAVAHYLMYMYKSRDYYNGKLPRYVWFDLKSRWDELCGQARGDDELPNLKEMEYLSNVWNQLIPMLNKNVF